MKLDLNLLRSMGIGKVFHHEEAGLPVRATSIDFDSKGDWMVTGSTDDSIRLYDVDSGNEKKVVYAQKHGASIVRMTHSPSAVLVASCNRGWDESIRYLSLHDNRYMRYFKGHSREVTSLEISPIYDGFLSASKDKTIRFWDLRSNVCQGIINCPGLPTVAYGPEGLVFALAVMEKGELNVKLYDARGSDKGPFMTCLVKNIQTSEVVPMSLVFSLCGRYILLPSVNGELHLINSFDGKVERVLKGLTHTKQDCRIQACFSPDSQFVLSGSEDGKIHVWNTETGEPMTQLSGHHESHAVTCVQWNPRKMLFASSGLDTALWIPKS